MRPVFVSLILIAAHISAEADCRAIFQLQQRQHVTGSNKTGTRSSSTTGRKSLNWGLNAAVKKGSYRGLLVVVPVRTATSNFVSIFDLRTKQFLCSNSKGQLIKSRQKDRPDCFLQRFRLNLAKRRHVFSSTSGKQLLKPGGGDEPPEVSSVLLERAKRHRRSKEVNPSDPLMSETHPSLPAKDGDKSQPEQDQAGAVSKETIASCDDPLRVLRPNGSGSPVKTNIVGRAEQN
ncbi:uncharacterized protein LOC101158272 [Oryzias latipes]|uniref:uncharacterized protein LOC101158272 n=1 Tax=Oryzias latipes TaxID=8090 RepID=UPI0002A4B3EE|nr:uncharacterized protein LOC101158272 [Oryzias latipes]